MTIFLFSLSKETMFDLKCCSFLWKSFLFISRTKYFVDFFGSIPNNLTQPFEISNSMKRNFMTFKLFDGYFLNSIETTQTNHYIRFCWQTNKNKIIQIIKKTWLLLWSNVPIFISNNKFITIHVGIVFDSIHHINFWTKSFFLTLLSIRFDFFFLNYTEKNVSLKKYHNSTHKHTLSRSFFVYQKRTHVWNENHSYKITLFVFQIMLNNGFCLVGDVFEAIRSQINSSIPTSHNNNNIHNIHLLKNKQNLFVTWFQLKF